MASQAKYNHDQSSMPIGYCNNEFTLSVTIPSKYSSVILVSWKRFKTVPRYFCKVMISNPKTSRFLLTTRIIQCPVHVGTLSASRTNDNIAASASVLACYHNDKTI